MFAQSPPVFDADAQATHVSVQAAPGAVFVRMRRQFGDQPAMRHMFAEMTAGEALALARELEAAVRVAAVTAFPP